MATIIGTYPNTYNINGKYIILTVDDRIINSDYREKQTGFCGVGNGRTIVICDTPEDLLSYIEENNLIIIDEQGQGVGERDLLASISEPLPFEFSDDEMKELNPQTETQWTAD